MKEFLDDVTRTESCNSNTVQFKIFSKNLFKHQTADGFVNIIRLGNLASLILNFSSFKDPQFKSKVVCIFVKYAADFPILICRHIVKDILPSIPAGQSKNNVTLLIRFKIYREMHWFLTLCIDNVVYVVFALYSRVGKIRIY